jgi:hypothetical protein
MKMYPAKPLALQSHPQTSEIRRLGLGKNRCQLSLSTGIAKLEALIGRLGANSVGLAKELSPPINQSILGF